MRERVAAQESLPMLLLRLLLLDPRLWPARDLPADVQGDSSGNVYVAEAHSTNEGLWQLPRPLPLQQVAQVYHQRGGHAPYGLRQQHMCTGAWQAQHCTA